MDLEQFKPGVPVELAKLTLTATYNDLDSVRALMPSRPAPAPPMNLRLSIAIVALTLLALAGPVTATPLLLFAAGARRIQMTTLGILQYISPSLQMSQGILLYGEAFPASRALGFYLIWAALILYAIDSWLATRK